MTMTTRQRRASVEARIDRSAGPNACHPWIGGSLKKGRPHLWVDGGKRAVKAYRWLWECDKGPIPEGQVLRHLCHNPVCMNLRHMTLGSQADNMTDSVRDGRTKTCAWWIERGLPHPGIGNRGRTRSP